MGATKRALEEFEEQAKWFVREPGKFVCAECLYDEFLVGWAGQSEERGMCTYCGTEGTIRPMDGLLELVGRGIAFEWGDPDSEGMVWDGEEKEYWGGATDTFDLVCGELDTITEVEALRTDIVQALPDHLWCRRDPYGPTPFERLSWGFRFFEGYVMHERRFFFHRAREEPDEPGEIIISIDDWLRSVAQGVRECGLVRQWAEGERVWRARVSKKYERFTTAAELGSPPVERAVQANRMSPPGIPVFYGALDADTAVAETFDPSRGAALASVGCFRLARCLRVVDLTALPDFPSLYDPDRRKQRRYLRFLRDFAERIARPIARDERIHVEYIPTQVVAEHFRYHIDAQAAPPLDGILWKSGRRADGVCVALFLKNSQCGEQGADRQKAAVHLDSLEHIELDARPD